MSRRPSPRSALGIGLLAAASLCLWAIARGPGRGDPNRSPAVAAAPEPAVSPPEAGPAPAAPSAAGPAQRAPSQPDADPPDPDLPRAPVHVASLAGSLPREALGRVLALRVWGARGLLAEGAPGAGGRFLLEVPRQAQPGELELRFDGGWSAWLGPFELEAGCRHELALAGLPVEAAPRRGRLAAPGPAALELEERFGSLWLTQRVEADREGRFEFLAARAGPFWARAEGGPVYLAAERPGLAAGDPLEFRAPPPLEPGGPVVAPRRRAWESLPGPPAPALDPGAEPATAAVSLTLVDSRGRALAGLPLRLEVEAHWTPPEDPGRTPLATTLEFEARSDRNGRCTFQGVSEGRAQLGPGRDAPWIELEAPAFDLAAGAELELGAVEARGLANVQGSCRDRHGRPLLGARLRLTHPRLNRPIEAASDEQGRFGFDGVPAGPGEIELLAPLGFPGLGRSQRLPIDAPAEATLELELALGP